MRNLKKARLKKQRRPGPEVLIGPEQQKSVEKHTQATLETSGKQDPVSGQI